MSGELTQAALKARLSYDKTTGVFRWREQVATHVQAGDVAGYVGRTGYRKIVFFRKPYQAHRLAWLYEYGALPSGPLDHINGTRDDNRIKNLREAKDQYEQLQNLPLLKANTSGYTGASFHKGTRRWRAQICVYGKKIHLGQFDTPEEAGRAYRDAKKRFHKFNPEIRDFDYAEDVL